MRIDGRIPSVYAGYLKNQTNVHLFGDSISRGYGLGIFADDPALSTSNPLYAFRSIANMANMVMADNGLPDVFTYRGNLYGSSSFFSTIASLIANNTIKAGDVCVFEDAGDSNMLPDDYQAQFESFRLAASSTNDISIVMMSMFDYSPAPTNCQFDTVFGTRTMNQATLAASQTSLSVVGPTSYIDMNAKMDYETTLGPYRMGAYAIPMMHPDGIHPNVWGQALMTGEILKACGYIAPLIRSCASLEAIASANKTALAYGSAYTSSFTGPISAAEMRYMILR